MFKLNNTCKTILLSGLIVPACGAFVQYNVQKACYIADKKREQKKVQKIKKGEECEAIYDQDLPD